MSQKNPFASTAQSTINSFKRKGAIISSLFIIPFLSYISYEYYRVHYMKRIAETKQLQSRTFREYKLQQEEVNHGASTQNAKMEQEVLFDCLSHVKKYFTREITEWKELNVLLKYIGSFSRADGAGSVHARHRKATQQFSILEEFFTENANAQEHFKTINFMRRLVLESEQHISQEKIRLLHNGHHRVDLEKLEVACLLAKAFFGLYTNRHDRETYYDLKYKYMPSVNMTQLFSEGQHSSDALRHLKKEKIKFIFQYFDTLRRRVERDGGRLESINRVPLANSSGWLSLLLPWQWELFSNKNTNASPSQISLYRETLPTDHTAHNLMTNTPPARLSTIVAVEEEGNIEEDKNCMQIDFANRFIGGGVYTHGCVQEEIRFLLSPELLVARLLCPVMSWNESISIRGTERFSKYKGYASTFAFDGAHLDDTFEGNQSHTTVVAMDALKFTLQRLMNQWKKPCIDREILKSFAAFKSNPLTADLEIISTGNWGCGTFNGDAELKFVLQWISASLAGKKLIYHTFHHPILSDKIQDFAQFAHQRNITAQQLYGALMTLSQQYGLDDSAAISEHEKYQQHYVETLKELKQILKHSTTQDEEETSHKHERI